MGNVAKSGFQIGIVSRDLGSFLSLRDKFDKYKQNVGHLLSRFELELLAPCRDELLGLLAESVPAVLQLTPAQNRGRHGVLDLVELLPAFRTGPGFAAKETIPNLGSRSLWGGGGYHFGPK